MTPWGRLGRAVWVGEARSVDEAIDIAELGWEVRTDEPIIVLSLGEPLKVPRARATVRLQPEHRALAAVGHTYTPIQNREALGLIGQIVEEERLRFEWAGEIDEGRRVFLVAAAPRGLEVPGDEIDLYYEALTSHDESTAFRLTLHPMMRSTGTLLSMSLPRVERRVVIKHTLKAGKRVEEAAEAIPKFREYLAMFARAVDRLVATPFGREDLTSLVAWTFRSASADAAADIAVEVEELFGRTPRNCWEAYCAVVRWISERRPIRGGGVRTSDEHRAMLALYDPTIMKLKDQAAKFLMRD